MILEAHTQDLSDDLAKSAVLIADGKQYMPVGWEGAQPGGHHRKGLLRFKAIVPKPPRNGTANTPGRRHVPKKFQMVVEVSG